MEITQKEQIFKIGNFVNYKQTNRNYIVLEESLFDEKYKRYNYAILDLSKKIFLENVEESNMKKISINELSDIEIENIKNNSILYLHLTINKQNALKFFLENINEEFKQNSKHNPNKLNEIIKKIQHL